LSLHVSSTKTLAYSETATIWNDFPPKNQDDSHNPNECLYTLPAWDIPIEMQFDGFLTRGQDTADK
jgi:hypothetical protein